MKSDIEVALPLKAYQVRTELDEIQILRKQVADYKIANSLLQSEYNLLGMVFDTTDALILMIDQQGKILRSNQSFNNRFTTPDKSVIGNSIEIFVQHDLSLIQRQEDFIHWFLSESRQEMQMVGSDGKGYVISWSWKVYLDENDAIQYIIATGIDITERKEFENLLVHERALLSSLIDSIDDLIFYKDLNGVYLGCNEAFISINGSKQKDLKGKTDFDFYPADVAKIYTDFDHQVLTSRHAISYENHSKLSNGQEFIFDTRKCPYFDPNGELLGVIGVVRDITKQKKTEEALQKAHTEIAQLISSLSSILIVLSSKYEVVHWNTSAERVFGISNADAVGQSFPELNIQLEWLVLQENIEKCLLEKRPKYMDPLRFVRLNGTEGFLGFNVSPVFDHAGNVTGTILLGGDITERKASENQLTQAQKLESIGQLAAGIAHEINTPVQYIGDNTQFLKDGFRGLEQILNLYERVLDKARDNPELKNVIKNFETEVQKYDMGFLRSEIPLAIEQSMDGIMRVSEIVRAMKEFSHPGVIQKIALDINKAIENTITVARNEWKFVADVSTKLTPDLPEVVCNPGEINQVLLNITINAAQAIGEAIKAKKYDKGELKFSTQLNCDRVEIRISDNANGIPEHARPRLFEPFFTTKEVGKGTGQGLAIAYNVVEVKHGGTITFETELGKGTTFIIQLPIQPCEEPYEDEPNHG